jgi:hypothetical protein
MVKFHRSDIHFWKAGRIGPLIVESDCVLGHEAAGIVLKVGEGVEDFVVGEFCCHSFFSSCPSFCSSLSLSLSPIIVAMSSLRRRWLEKLYGCVQKRLKQEKKRRDGKSKDSRRRSKEQKEQSVKREHGGTNKKTKQQ